MDQDLLVGCTGFVGGNLQQSHRFTKKVHSTNIHEAYGMNPDHAVYAGIPSAMFLANADPEADLAIMKQARDNLRKINPRTLTLVSTIAVYPNSESGHEETPIDPSRLSAYGANRLQLEDWVREDYPEALIVRLPALYGKGLKKNFIFDMINIVPGLLKEKKYRDLSSSSSLVAKSYEPGENGFWKLRPEADLVALRDWFESNDFNALSFTDSRSSFQFYDLGNLWNDIVEAREKQWLLLNLATPPVSAAEVYEYVNGASWHNELVGEPFSYDMRSVHTCDVGGNPGYRCTRDEELSSIKRFIEESRS